MNIFVTGGVGYIGSATGRRCSMPGIQSRSMICWVPVIVPWCRKNLISFMRLWMIVMCWRRHCIAGEFDAVMYFAASLKQESR